MKASSFSLALILARAIVSFPSANAQTQSVKSIPVIGGSPLFSQDAEGAERAWKWEKAEHETSERLEVEIKP